MLSESRYSDSRGGGFSPAAGVAALPSSTARGAAILGCDNGCAAFFHAREEHLEADVTDRPSKVEPMCEHREVLAWATVACPPTKAGLICGLRGVAAVGSIVNNAQSAEYGDSVLTSVYMKHMF